MIKVCMDSRMGERGASRHSAHVLSLIHWPEIFWFALAGALQLKYDKSVSAGLKLESSWTNWMSNIVSMVLVHMMVNELYLYGAFLAFATTQTFVSIYKFKHKFMQSSNCSSYSYTLIHTDGGYLEFRILLKDMLTCRLEELRIKTTELMISSLLYHLSPSCWCKYCKIWRNCSS